MLDQVGFLGARVSRLIVGDNPVNGHSYIPELISGDDMLDYYTERHLHDAMAEAAVCGYNTWMPLANEFMLRAIRHYRNKGNDLPVLFQSYPAVDFQVNVRQMAAFQPLGIYHQGTTTDSLYEQGRFGVIRDRILMIHDAGYPAGIGTHLPEAVRRAEEEGWGCDFYTVCLHNTRKRLGTDMEESSFITGKPKHLKFYMEDRAEMLAVIRQTPKPCIAFKLFAGGQIFYHLPPEGARLAVESAMYETFSGVKPGDIAAIGCFQRDQNQLRENAEAYARAALRL